MNKLSFWFDFQRDAFKGSLRIVRKNWLATSMTIFTIVVMLSLSAIFGMLSNIMHSTDLDWHNSKQITLYLNVPTMESEEQDLLEQVIATDGVGEATLRSSADALIIMQDELGMQDILGYLSTNPLPAAIDVIPSSSVDSSAKLIALYNVLKSYTNVESAKMDMESIKRISLFLEVIANIFKVVIFLIVMALVLVIANSLRLIISDRVDEISVLKFIGASDKFIRRPYLYIGILYGLLSALLTIVFVNYILINMREQINDLLSTYAISYETAGLSMAACGLLISVAIFIGWFGARFAARKYLKSEPRP